MVQPIRGAGVQLCAGLATRRAGEPPAVALRRAVLVLVVACRYDPARSLRLTKTMFGTPSLLGRYHERQGQWRRDLAAELGLRLGLDPARDLRPDLAAGDALIAFDTALSRWAASDGTQDLHAPTDQAPPLVA